MKRKTHCEIIFDILKDKNEHHIIEIAKIGFPNCINVAIRSRISDLKKKGLKIISRLATDRQAIYRYIPQEKQGELLYD